MHEADFLISVSLNIKWALVATCLTKGPTGNRMQGKFHGIVIGLKETGHEQVPDTSTGTQQVLNKCLQDLKEFEKASWIILIHSYPSTDLLQCGMRTGPNHGAERKVWT